MITERICHICGSLARTIIDVPRPAEDVGGGEKEAKSGGAGVGGTRRLSAAGSLKRIKWNLLENGQSIFLQSRKSGIKTPSMSFSFLLKRTKPIAKLISTLIIYLGVTGFGHSITAWPQPSAFLLPSIY